MMRNFRAGHDTHPFVQHNHVDAEIKAADPKYYPEGTARKKAQKRVNYF